MTERLFKETPNKDYLIQYLKSYDENNAVKTAVTKHELNLLTDPEVKKIIITVGIS
jgi:hypothetical protein